MQKFDVVIYGATLAGISAAYWLGRQGFSVCVLEPSPYIGGAIAGGLSWQDFPPDNLASQILAGRVTGDFFRENAMATYRRPLTDYTDRGLEPKTSARLLRDMLRQSNAYVKTNVRLEKRRRYHEKGRITAVHTADGPISGDFWIGASYEGDLGHHAGITYTSGRESEDRLR